METAKSGMYFLTRENIIFQKGLVFVLLLGLIFASGINCVLAQDSQSVLYVPLIGLTLVPNPFALPKGEGNVVYSYAVKNFLRELPLTNIKVVDDSCSPVKYVTGDDNGNSMLDYNETWRYVCSTKIAKTTQSTAIASGAANNMTVTHQAYASVVVGSNNPPPLVSIINVTKVAYPLSLPQQGGKITFTYRVTNPGVVPLSDVTVTDNKCQAMSGKLGDTNHNNLLDTNEVWIYTCITTLRETTTNTVSVTAFANGLQAIDHASITVKVDNSNSSSSSSSPTFPQTGTNPDLKATVWKILGGILVILMIVYVLTQNAKSEKTHKKPKSLRRR